MYNVMYLIQDNIIYNVEKLRNQSTLNILSLSHKILLSN